MQKGLLVFLIITLIKFQSARVCNDYCLTEFKDTAYCLSNRRIYPSVCSATCSESELNILFVCKLNKNQDLRACQARCARSNIGETDKLFNQCDCPRIYNPICAENEETFFNDCFRICNRQNRKSQDCDFCDDNEDKEGCLQRCSDNSLGYCDAPEFELENMSYDPVCGSDGNIYANEGLMKLAEIEIGEEGSCEAKATRRLKNVETF